MCIRDRSYPVRYHIASGDQPKIYTATAMSSSGNITAGGSCSCSVVLGCPATRYDPNEAAGIIEGCDNQCDFSVDPDLAHNNNPLTFSIDVYKRQLSSPLKSKPRSI